jgi:hypothetical protein
LQILSAKNSGRRGAEGELGIIAFLEGDTKRASTIGGRCALFCVALGSPQQLDESAVRRIARTVVLANYIGHDSLEKIGWCYWTQGIYNSWKQGQAAFTNHVTAVQFSHIDPSPFAQAAAPSPVVLQPFQLQILSTLFYIEDDFVAGLTALDSLIHQGELSPRSFENALGSIGSALSNLENFGQG